jgi:CrcB protein
VIGGLALVAVGGALGSVARYGVVRGTAAIFGDHQPWGTLLVNVLGSLLMGLVAAFIARKMTETESARLLLMPGFLGGFTTFSAFSLDVFNLMQRGENGTALGYALASVVLSVTALFAGYALVARSIS